MEKLIEILQNEKLSHRTKRLMCALYALHIEKGSQEIDISVFANLLGESKSAIIASCQELEDSNMYSIDEYDDREYIHILVENNITAEVVIKLI
jgi:hypothetical protein